MKSRLTAVLGFLLTVTAVRAQFQNIFMIGTNNASTSEFEQENVSNNKYYWENGDYTVAGLGGVNWTGGQEAWLNTTDAALGFPRALIGPSGHTFTDIYFQLDPAEAGVNQPLRLTLDLFALKANTTHDLEASFNNSTPFWTDTAIAADKLVVIDARAGAAGARTGANKLTIRRTGGAIDGGNAWIQFDYLQLQADPSVQFINSFTTNDALLRPGETATLTWTLFEANATVSINQGIGDVTPLTSNGTGSIQVTPAANTTYTLTAMFNAQSQTRNVTVNATSWGEVFEAGIDNGLNTEFSHEVAADDKYYFAGDYTSAGGPVQAANEILNDDTNTNTVAGRTGNPAIGFERAVTESDPHQDIWFIPNPASVNVTARHRITVDVLSVGSGGGGVQTHNLEISLNGTVLRNENGINGPRLVQFEVGGITSGLRTGPNYLTVRRTGGTFAGWIMFDYMMLEYLPGTAPAITGITDDPILGTHTVAWTSQATRTYRIQKSADAGASWQDLAGGFPTGGAPSTSLFYEDRATPRTDPRPEYRVLQE